MNYSCQRSDDLCDYLSELNNESYTQSYQNEIMTQDRIKCCNEFDYSNNLSQSCQYTQQIYFQNPIEESIEKESLFNSDLLNSQSDINQYNLLGSENKEDQMNTNMNNNDNNEIESEESKIQFNNENIIDQQCIDNTLKSNNIIKNLIKQYYNYLMKPSNSSLVSDFIIQKPISYSKKLIKKYFKGISFNNSCLIKILKHEKYGKGLEYYLTFDAYEELSNSKVQNISEHIEAIMFLKKCCGNHSLLDQINFYKKKGKNSE